MILVYYQCGLLLVNYLCLHMAMTVKILCKYIPSGRTPKGNQMLSMHIVYDYVIYYLGVSIGPASHYIKITRFSLWLYIMVTTCAY